MTKIKKSESVGVEHEYVDLDVEEISVVDVPANTKEFAVIKCVGNDKPIKEEPLMAEEKVEKTSTDQNAKVDEVPVDVAENDTAIEQVLTHLNSIEKTMNDLTTSGDEEEDESDGKVETEKASDKEETPENVFMKALKENGIEGEKLKETMEKYKGAFSCNKVSKSSDDETQEEEVVDIADQLSEIARKAKAMTPKRFEAIKQAQQILMKLVKEIEMIPEGKSPKTKVPSNSSFGESGLKDIMKVLGQVTENLSSLSETIKKNSDKIEKIEKTHRPSTSLENNETVKKEKGEGEETFWNGAL